MARKKTNFFKKKISGLMQKKLVMLFGAIILAFVFLIGWITYINASKGEKYTKVVLDQQQYNNRTIPFKRGDIVDRRHKTCNERKSIQCSSRCQDNYQ